MNKNTQQQRQNDAIGFAVVIFIAIIIAFG